jgi:glucosamine--fructose-6-phosphate aminotransferase (isomerizing)
MCGIFGLIQKEHTAKTGKAFRDLFILSESRGKEAAGFAIKRQGNISVFKTPFSASNLISGKVFRNEIGRLKKDETVPFIGIGHSRLVTDGYEQYDINNQPVVKNGMVVIHNGIIVNKLELWKIYNEENRISELDSELIPTIIENKMKAGKSFGKAIGVLFNEIYGMTNFALLSDYYSNLVLATNNGSIYYINDLENGFFVFASERFILEQLLRKYKFNLAFDLILQLNPGELVSINLNLLSFQLAKNGENLVNLEENSQKSEIVFLKSEKTSGKIYMNTSLEHNTGEINKIFIDQYINRKEAIENLKRCTKCILPETFPNIEYDKDGICNYCNAYHRIDYKGKESLELIVNDFRNKDSGPDCLVPFSGGRDSSYALHYVVKEIGLKPIAFSYDWGMLTDLARRNQARMCGKLGVEHILVSADIRKKRENIRKNVLAWLKRPDLGTIPLFMAGDKQYFYFANLLMKQNNLKLSILGENLLETTNFKSGFCGIKPNFAKSNTYNLSWTAKFKMATYYGKQYLRNPAYINSSLLDTLDSFKSYYIIKHRNLNIYNYLKWDEKIITETLLKEYQWETDPGTRTTWRIGDGTAAFYNYIYYMIAGFTENDTFRSNQIREGDLTREESLALSITENQPRWDSIQWYCRAIAIDFENAIIKINKIPALYP